jgi:hypothetical protein
VEKYVHGRYIKGNKEVDPWSLAPLKDVERRVLELELTRPDDADDGGGSW